MNTKNSQLSFIYQTVNQLDTHFVPLSIAVRFLRFYSTSSRKRCICITQVKVTLRLSRAVYLWFAFNKKKKLSVTSARYCGMDDLLDVLLGRRSELVLAFKFNLRDLAHLMHAERFLSDADHETVTAVKSMLNNSDKADIMVNSLITKVELDHNNYQIFYNLVQHKKRKFEEVVKLLAPGESNKHFS